MPCSNDDIARNLAGLRAGEAHVWLSFTETSQAAVKPLWKVLSDEERTRAEKIQLAENRVEFVLAHALVRAVLSRCHPVAPGAWQFGREAQGKPFVSAPVDAPALQFNLTHTRGLSACVVALNAAVGVDAERIEPLADLPELARRFLAPAAARELENLSGEQRLVQFYEHWTRQEACGKACGVGLASLSCVNESAADWRFFQQRVSPDHVLAVAVRGQPGTTTVFRLRTAVWQMQGDECRLAELEPDRTTPAR